MIKNIFKVPLALSRTLANTSMLLLNRSVASSEPKPHQVLTQYIPLAPNSVWDNAGSTKRPKRVGRGPGSGKG